MKVIKKTIIEDKRNYYDLTITKTHNFCLSNGEVVHNTGVGFSCQNHHVEQLPDIDKPRKDRKRRFLVGDSIEGWADAIKVLMRSYFEGGSTIDFDFSDIRQKGARLVTSGGKAPGPQPLKECLVKIEGILGSKENGEKLKPIEVHDIICHIADAVLAGGIRRAALISLFSADDEEMLACKSGNWWELNPQRGRANNSAVILRHRITEDYFRELWERIELSGAGEPGLYFTNDKDWGSNPCCEIALRPFQFCNLTTMNVSDVDTQEELNNRSKAASFIASLQAGYTNFHYLRPIWKRTTEKDALLGVSMTGIASDGISNLNLKEASKIVIAENKRVSKMIGTNQAARCTTIKPEGTGSLILGTSSGIHAWHNDFYIRRIRVNKNEAIYTYLSIYHPELLEDEYFRPTETSVISVPIMSPKGSILRTESPLSLLDRVKKFNIEWIRSGHRSGENTHNVSATINLKDNEWEDVGKWVWENRESFNGLSFLPYDSGTYKQAPFEDITEEQFNELSKNLHEVDLSLVVELDDNTTMADNIACGPGGCEIT